MAGFRAIPAHGRKVLSYSLDASADFLAGAAVLIDTDQEIIECGADPDAVLGFAAHPALGRDILEDECLVFVAHSDATFWIESDGDPWVAADVNEEYGLVKSSDGLWRVDKSGTGTVVCVRVDLIRNLGEVAVLAGVRQQDV